MHFEQSCSTSSMMATYKTTVDFHEDKLHYSFDNGEKKIGGAIYYQNIPPYFVEVKEKRGHVKHAVLIAISVLVLAKIQSFSSGNPKDFQLFAFFVVVFGGAYAVLLMLRSAPKIITIYTNPEIRILADRNHKKILDEIWKRRREKIYKKYANVDFDKPYYEEVEKFNWLKEEGIVSEAEWLDARKKIAALKSESLPDVNKPVN